MANISLPRPAVGPTTQRCVICGSSTYCGGTFCPSSSLPVGYDGVPQVQEKYISNAVGGISAGIYIGYVPQVGG